MGLGFTRRRNVTAETGISKTCVQRYIQLLGLQPHRTESFKLSNVPFFIKMLRDLVGLYLSPTDNALAICVDKKSPCQALERTQPMLPMGSAMSKASPTTTSAMVRPRSLPLLVQRIHHFVTAYNSS